MEAMKKTSHEVANEAAAIVRGLVAGEAERGAAVAELRKVIEARDASTILAMRSYRETMLGDSRGADVWVRTQLSNAVRGKEFASLPRLTIKKQKILPGRFMYSVEEKAAMEKESDEEKTQDAIGEAINVLRACLQAGVEMSEENAVAFSILKDEMQAQ